MVIETLRNEGISQQNRVANILGIGMGAPTIIEYGTEEQISKYLRPMFTTEEIWCQLFSEPGSGSDLASLSTKAVDDGDGYIVNGQKVWTTLGHLAKWGLIVTRTDPNVPKHRGLTFFIVDMESEGVDVRPLRQITGEAEFNEVYFTDVKIPKEILVTTMEVHQKYFPTFDNKENLTNVFFVVADNNDPKGLIKLGNERVVEARLNDAQFFWDKNKQKILVKEYQNTKKRKLF